jgi:hypothetical protein
MKNGIILDESQIIGKTSFKFSIQEFDFEPK